MSKSILLLTITMLLPPYATHADALGSNYTRAALTLLDPRSHNLPSQVVAPSLVYERGAVRIALDGIATRRILSQRKRDDAAVAHAVEVVVERLRSAIESGTVLSVDDLRPDLHSLHGQQLRDGIVLDHELEVLVLQSLQSLLDGASAITVAGVPVRSVRIERYETPDALGKVAV